MRLRVRSVFVAGVAILAARPGTCTDLADLLQTASDVTLAPNGHDPHFSYQLNPENRDLIDTLNGYIAGQFATFPLGSSAGGFTFNFDPATGVGTRSSNTFGPQFAERALTIGKGKFNVGAQFLHATYKSINGIDLEDGSLTVQLRHEDLNGDGRTNPGDYWEGDVITDELAVDLTLDTMLIVGTWGVTDRFDLGAAIPIIQAEMGVSATQTILRLATGNESGPFFTHRFDDTGRAVNLTSQNESATGLGDIVLRGKYNFLDPKKKSAFALAMDVRVPTGDEDNLMGTGVTQAKLFGIGSWALGRWSPHVNGGYTATFGDSRFGSIPDEANYAVGLEIEAHSRVTVLADVIGRTLLDATVIAEGTDQFDYNFGGVSAVQSEFLTQLQANASITENLNILQGSLGLKINPGGNWLISIGALIPLSDDGLESDPIALIGFDFYF